ncbi:MAG: hypothetical protein V1662_04460, partial [Candidatus Omnitrophota bacterium]
MLDPVVLSELRQDLGQSFTLAKAKEYVNQQISALDEKLADVKIGKSQRKHYRQQLTEYRQIAVDLAALKEDTAFYPLYKQWWKVLDIVARASAAEGSQTVAGILGQNWRGENKVKVGVTAPNSLTGPEGASTTAQVQDDGDALKLDALSNFMITKNDAGKLEIRLNTIGEYNLAKGAHELFHIGIKNIARNSEKITEEKARKEYRDELAILYKVIRTESGKTGKALREEVDRLATIEELGPNEVITRFYSLKKTAEALSKAENEFLVRLESTRSGSGFVGHANEVLETKEDIVRTVQAIQKVTVAKSQVEKAGLDWSDVSKKLIDNSWAKQISATEVRLTANPEAVKDRMSGIFGENFSKISPILQESQKMSDEDLIRKIYQHVEEQKHHNDAKVARMVERQPKEVIERIARARDQNKKDAKASSAIGQFDQEEQGILHLPDEQMPNFIPPAIDFSLPPMPGIPFSKREDNLLKYASSAIGKKADRLAEPEEAERILAAAKRLGAELANPLAQVENHLNMLANADLHAASKDQYGDVYRKVRNIIHDQVVPAIIKENVPAALRLALHNIDTEPAPILHTNVIGPLCAISDKLMWLSAADAPERAQAYPEDILKMRVDLERAKIALIKLARMDRVVLKETGAVDIDASISEKAAQQEIAIEAAAIQQRIDAFNSEKQGASPGEQRLARNPGTGTAEANQPAQPQDEEKQPSPYLPASTNTADQGKPSASSALQLAMAVTMPEQEYLSDKGTMFTSNCHDNIMRTSAYGNTFARGAPGTLGVVSPYRDLTRAEHYADKVNTRTNYSSAQNTSALCADSQRTSEEQTFKTKLSEQDTDAQGLKLGGSGLGAGIGIGASGIAGLGACGGQKDIEDLRNVFKEIPVPAERRSLPESSPVEANRWPLNAQGLPENKGGKGQGASSGSSPADSAAEQNGQYGQGLISKLYNTLIDTIRMAERKWLAIKEHAPPFRKLALLVKRNSSVQKVHGIVHGNYSTTLSVGTGLRPVRIPSIRNYSNYRPIVVNAVGTIMRTVVTIMGIFVNGISGSEGRSFAASKPVQAAVPFISNAGIGINDPQTANRKPLTEVSFVNDIRGQVQTLLAASRGSLAAGSSLFVGTGFVPVVIPAEAGIQNRRYNSLWMPVFPPEADRPSADTGMTVNLDSNDNVTENTKGVIPCLTKKSETSRLTTSSTARSTASSASTSVEERGIYESTAAAKSKATNKATSSSSLANWPKTSTARSEEPQTSPRLPYARRNADNNNGGTEEASSLFAASKGRASSTVLKRRLEAIAAAAGELNAELIFERDARELSACRELSRQAFALREVIQQNQNRFNSRLFEFYILRDLAFAIGKRLEELYKRNPQEYIF